jgi:hypothetical protein
MKKMINTNKIIIIIIIETLSIWITKYLISQIILGAPSVFLIQITTITKSR